MSLIDKRREKLLREQAAKKTAPPAASKPAITAPVLVEAPKAIDAVVPATATPQPVTEAPEDFADLIIAIKKKRGMISVLKAPEEDPDILAKLDAFDGQSAALQKRMADVQWRSVHGDQTPGEMEALGQQNADLVERTGYVELVRDGLLSNPPDPEVRRELALRYRQLQLAHVHSHPALQDAFAFARAAQDAFQVTIDRTAYSPHEVEMMLSSSEDPLTRIKASLAKRQSMSLATPKLMLARGLSQATQELEGRESYAHLLMELQDSTVEGFTGLVAGFERKTKIVMDQLNDMVCATFKLKAVPHRDANFFYSSFFGMADSSAIPKDPSYAMEKLSLTLAAMGFGKVHGARFLDPQSMGKPPFTYSISPAEGLSEQEFALRVAPGVPDYRVFINPAVSASGLEYMRTVLLESARAIHFYSLDRLDSRDVFKWDSDCMRNAIAMLISSVVSEEKWLRDVAGVGADDAQKLSSRMEFNNIRMARRLAADALFEFSLFCGEDPQETYHRIEEWFHGASIDYDVGNTWAWHPYLAAKPGAQITYTLGYLIFELMRKDLLNTYGTLLHPKVAEHIIDNYFTGYKVPWPERLKGLVERDLIRDSLPQTDVSE